MCSRPVWGIIDVLAGGDAPFLASGGEARRALKENSISVNRNKVTAERELGLDDCIGSGLILLQRRKKELFLGPGGRLINRTRPPFPGLLRGTAGRPAGC